MYSNHKHSSQFHGCARSKPQFVTAVPNLKSCHWTRVLRVGKAYQHYNCEIVSWKHFHFLMEKNSSVSVAGINHSRFYADNHTALDMIDHVLANISRQLMSSQVAHFHLLVKRTNP